jgi:hypothetical protein
MTGEIDGRFSTTNLGLGILVNDGMDTDVCK